MADARVLPPDGGDARGPSSTAGSEPAKPEHTTPEHTTPEHTTPERATTRPTKARTKAEPAKGRPTPGRQAAPASSGRRTPARKPAAVSAAIPDGGTVATPDGEAPGDPRPRTRSGPRPAPKNLPTKVRPRPVPDPDDDPTDTEPDTDIDAGDDTGAPVRRAVAAQVPEPPARPTSITPRSPGTRTPNRTPTRASSRPSSGRIAVPAVSAATVARSPRPSGVTSINAIRPARPPAAAPGGNGRGRYEAAATLAQQAGERLVDLLSSAPKVPDVQERVGSVLEFLRRRLTGAYDVDEFGFDPEFTDTVVLALLRPLYEKWFRVEVRGIENVPATGGALVVANHSGTIAMDAVMTGVAIRQEHPAQRHLRMLGADLVFDVPVLSQLARRSGATLANNADAERLLSGGHLVGVWPEGFKGVGKPFRERYKLQRFGRGGFVTAALRTGVPIVPCSIVGAEEIYPMIGNVPSLARLLNIPYLPITPTFPWLGPLGLIPLPSKWLIDFSPPVATSGFEAGAADDPMLVFDLTDQVRQTIQQTLYSLLVQRRSVFF